MAHKDGDNNHLIQCRIKHSNESGKVSERLAWKYNMMPYIGGRKGETRKIWEGDETHKWWGIHFRRSRDQSTKAARPTEV